MVNLTYDNLQKMWQEAGYAEAKLMSREKWLARPLPLRRVIIENLNMVVYEREMIADADVPETEVVAW